MPAVVPRGSVPVPFSISLTGTGTAQWQNKQLLAAFKTGKVLGIVVDVDDNTQLGSVTVYCVSGDTDVTATPPTRKLSYASAALAPSVDDPAPFLNETVDNPMPFQGLRLALLATWTGPCVISGTVFVDAN